MRLLISVRDGTDAREALSGGADIIDAKDPERGALGPVSSGVLREIRAVVGGRRPVSAALGDATTEGDVELAAREAGSTGLAYIKLGLGGVASATQARALLGAAVRGVRAVGQNPGVIAVAYADAARIGSLPPLEVVDTAARVGAHGVLLDSAFKDGPGVFSLLGASAIGAWIAAAHAASLIAALAGQITAADVGAAVALGADIVGARGAACDGGRNGRISRARVRSLILAMGSVPMAGDRVHTREAAPSLESGRYGG